VAVARRGRLAGRVTAINASDPHVGRFGDGTKGVYVFASVQARPIAEYFLRAAVALHHKLSGHLAFTDERIFALVVPSSTSPLPVRELFAREMPRFLASERHRWRWAGLGLTQFDVAGDDQHEGGTWSVDFSSTADQVTPGPTAQPGLRIRAKAVDLLKAYIGMEVDLLRVAKVVAPDPPDLGKLQKALALFGR
jgi:hypothetical protein